jgi:trans-aconitate methyltransferase
LGIDASAEMIGFARKTFPTSTISNLKFELLDARKIRFPQAFDLVFSNAALHWVDDHQAFLGGASGCLRSGGRLVVSCGGKGNAQDVFAALRAEMRSGRWREFFRRMDRPYFFYSPGDYGKWLASAGFESRAVRLTDKTMAFENRRQFAGWFRTTWLPYTQRVPEPVRGEFIAGIVDCYLASHPADAAGCIHVRMVRLEIDAVKV